MNMKKAFAGFMAGAVAVSAMATMAVSAKNELTFTQDQSAIDKTWDLTATKFPVTWVGTTTISLTTTTGATPGQVLAGTTAIGGLTFTSNSTTTNVQVEVIDGTTGVTATNPVAITTRTTTVNGATVPVITITADITGAAAASTAAAAVTALDAAKNLAGSPLATILADVKYAPTTAGAALAATAATALAAAYQVSAGTAASNTPIYYASPLDNQIFYLGFRENDAAAKIRSVSSAKLTVKGYVNSTVANVAPSLNTIEINLVKVGDDMGSYSAYKPTNISSADFANYWAVENVAMNTAQSVGKIDLSSFTGGIVEAKVEYTIKDDSKEKKSDAESLADTTIFKLKGDVEVYNKTNGNDTATEYFADFQDGFDWWYNNNNTINTGKGKVESVDTIHGPIFTGYNMSAVKGKATGVTVGAAAGTEIWTATVAAKDTIYYLNGTKLFPDGASVGGVSANSSFKKAVTFGDRFALTEDAAKTLAINLANADPDEYLTKAIECDWQNMLKEIQSLIGDAKGATLTFNVYSTSATDEGKGVNKFSGGTDAPLASSASAEDFAFAVNTQSSNKFYQAKNMVDGKITLNWDDITQGLAAGTIMNGAIRISAGKAFQIDSISLNVPAKTLADLTVGEGTTGSEESLGGEASSEAASSEAASSEAPATTSPATGNAPIALAAIPVALAAAVVVAKKRK